MSKDDVSIDGVGRGMELLVDKCNFLLLARSEVLFLVRFVGVIFSLTFAPGRGAVKVVKSWFLFSRCRSLFVFAWFSGVIDIEPRGGDLEGNGAEARRFDFSRRDLGKEVSM